MIFWKKTFTVFLGVFSSQLISILGSVAIAAICLPEHFGYFSSWLGIVSIFSVGFTFRYEALFVVFGDKEKQKEAVENTIWISTFVSVIAFVGVGIASFCFFNDQVVAIKYTSATVAGFLISLNMILQSWAVARGDLKTLNIFRVIYAGSTILLQILFGFIFRNGLSLTAGFALGLFLSAGFSLFLSPSLSWVPAWSKAKNVLGFVKNYKQFPLFSLPADLISSLTASLPVILTYEKFGAEKSGFLALTIRILAGPLGLVGRAVLDVFKKEASNQYEANKNCSRIYGQTFLVLSFFSLLFFVFAYLLIEKVFLIMYGPDWITSAEIGKVLLALFCFQLIASPLSYVVYIVQKQQFDLIWQIGLLGVTFGSFSFQNDFWVALRVYCLGSVCMYIIYFLLNYYFSFGKRD